jgi:hypothetical protein
MAGPWKTRSAPPANREPLTTNLFDRHDYNPEKSTSFFATY